MASSDDDNQMRNKVEDILAATAPEHVVCQHCDEVIPEGCKSLSVGLFQCKTLDKRCWAALKSLQRLTHKKPDMKVDRCRSSVMGKFKCIGLTLRTEDNYFRIFCQRNETVEYITMMVKFNLVKRISGVLMLDKESFQAYQKQWYGCSLEEAKAKWKSTLASPHVHREKVDGVMQVAVKKPTEILHEHSIGIEERTSAKTSNVDKRTAKQLLSDLSESHIFGAESSDSELLGTGSDASETDDDGQRRPEASRRRRPCLQGSCACAARASGQWQRQLGLREAEHQGFFEVHSSKDRRQG